MSVIRFELWMNMTHRLDPRSQEHVSNWIWALNVRGDSLSRCKLTAACQQLNLSSECPEWLTAWMQVHRSMSVTEFELWIVHGNSQAGCKFTGGCQQLDLSSEFPWKLTPWMQVHRSTSEIEFELWMSLMTHCLDASWQEHVSNWIWALNVHGDSLPGCKLTGACQQLNLSSECPWWLTS